MPLYPYFCEKCDKSTDILKSISAMDSKETCPDCKKEMIRMLSTANVQPGVTPRFHPRIK